MIDHIHGADVTDRRALHIDAVCDEFEQAFRAGQSPRLEDYLGHVEEAHRPAAFRELLKVEVELRRARQEAVNADDYLERFRSFEAAVLDICHQSDVAPASDAGKGGPRRVAGSESTCIAGDSKTASGRLEVRCPSCRAPMDVAVDTQLTDLTCSACGSHFSLVDQSQATRMAPSLSKMGRFELIERLGVGGFGSVWKARDKELDRTVAVKVPRAGGMTAEEQEKFFREARAAAQLRHPNIVSVHEVGRDGDSVYIVSDFVRGVTLGDWLTGQQLTSREAAELCAKIADALHHAHEQGVVHRDLKPANIMIDGEGDPHLMDFGLARREVGEVTVTMDGHVLGTPAYMSPEQAEGKAHTADRRSDIYSLGVILFQLLTGELPFRGNARMLIHQVIHDEPPSPRKLNGNVPRDLETVTLKCLQKTPEKRYDTAQEFAAELRRILAGEPIRALPISRRERIWRWCRRHPQVASLTALLLLALTCGTAISTILAARAQRSATQYRQERDRAQENLRLAEAAVHSYLVQVASDERLKEDDFHALRAGLLESAIPFYEQFAEQMPGDAAQEANRSKAHARLASIHSETGRGEKSLAQYERAIAILNSLVERHPGEPQYTRALADSSKELAWNLFLSGDLEQAEELYQQALSLYETLTAEFPDEPAHRASIASTRTAYGMLLRRSDSRRAREQFEKAIDIQRTVAQHDANKAEYSAALAKSSYLLGHLLHREDPVAAMGYLSDAAGLQRALVERTPRTSAYRSALADTVSVLAAVTEAMGDHSDASKLHEEALAIQQRLVADFPGVVRFRAILGTIHLNYGNFLGVGDLQSALEHYDAYRSIYTRLATESPTTPHYLRNAIQGYKLCAIASLQLGNPEEATQYCQEVLGLVDEGVTDPGALNALAWMLATSYQDTFRDGAKAIELATKACELTDYQDPGIVDTLAAAYAEVGDFGAAVRWGERTLELLKEETSPQVRQRYASALARYRAGNPTRQLTSLEQYSRLPRGTRRLVRQWRGLAQQGLVPALARTSDEEVADQVAATDNIKLAAESDASQPHVDIGSLRELCRASAAQAKQAVEASAAIPVSIEASPQELLFVGELRIIGGRPEEAVTLIERAIAQGGNEPFYHKSLGWALIGAGRRVEAIAALETALGDKTLQNADLDQLAACYLASKIDDAAFLELAKSKPVKHAVPFAWFYIGQRHAWEGDRQAATAAFAAAIREAERAQVSNMIVNFAEICRDLAFLDVPSAAE